MRFHDLTQLLTGLAPVLRTLIPEPTQPTNRAAFVQGDWMAELELLQLAQDLRSLAETSGGFEGELFDLMVSIADVLERDHGWDRTHSNEWLIRMGLWDEDRGA